MNLIKYLYNKKNNEENYNTINKMLGILDNLNVYSPIDIEILMNNKEQVIKEINKGINLNEITLCGTYPLILATITNNYDLVDLLIKNGADVNINNGYSALNIASKFGNYKLIKLLLENGANIDFCDEYGFNALHNLLDNRTVINLNNNISPYIPYLENSIYSNKSSENIIKCIDLLVLYGIDINKLAKTYLDNSNNNIIEINPLSIALEGQNEKVIKKLIDLGSSREVFEICPDYIYEYQDNFGLSKEYIRYLKYKNLIKKYDIKVYTSKITNDYKRPKIIKKY